MKKSTKTSATKSTKKSATKSTKKNAKRLRAQVPQPSMLSRETLSPKDQQTLEKLRKQYTGSRRLAAVKRIPVALLVANPYQPMRTLFAQLLPLITAISGSGSIAPITVCKVNPLTHPLLEGKYWVIDGHRRGTGGYLLGEVYVMAQVLPTPETKEALAKLWKIHNSGNRIVSSAEEFNSWSRAETPAERATYLEQMTLTSSKVVQDIKALIRMVGMDDTLRLARAKQERGLNISPSQPVLRTKEVVERLKTDPTLDHYATKEWTKRIALWFATMPGAGHEVGASKIDWYPLTKQQKKQQRTQTLRPEEARAMLQAIMDAVTTNTRFDYNTARGR